MKIWNQAKAIRLSQLRPGDKVVVDAGFTCIKPWAVRTVKADYTGELFILCKEKKHSLDGQLRYTGSPPRSNGWLTGVRRLS